jgi:predicted permease
MNWITQLFKRQEIYEDLSDEIREHLEEKTRELIESGMSAEEAAYAARRQFGNVALIEERGREPWHWSSLENVLQDVRIASRVVRKSPGFAIVAVLTLALAIGANAVVFAVLNALILRPLDVPEPDSLYAVWRVNATSEESYPDYLDLRDRNRSFDGLAGWSVDRIGVNSGGESSLSWIEEGTGNYFDVLHIQPYLGRLFHQSDEHGVNSAPSIVLSYEFWHTHFHDDRGVVGRTVELNKHPFTILGVTPPEFHGCLMFFHPDFFVPLVNQQQLHGTNTLNERGAHSTVFMVMGHLKPGVTPEQASADLTSIGSYLEKTYPKDHARMTFTLARPSLYGDYLGRPLKAFMTGLMLLAGLILLAACANLGSLFAARAADRSREVALRLALGSTRTRILRQVFTEAVLISLVGGAVGLWGSIVLVRGLSSWQPFARWPVYVPVHPDVKVYLVALFLALASGFLFGAVPVRQILHTSPYEVVKSGSTGPTGKRITARDLLLVAQIAICAVLVTSSMVAVRGLIRSLHSNFGFNPENVMLVDTELTMAGYNSDRVPAMQKRMIEAAAAIPGVESVGLADRTPLNGDQQGLNVFTDKTSDLRPANAAAQANRFVISPEYLQAAQTTLLSGRNFTWHDDQNAPRVAIINQEFARKIFGSASKAMAGYYRVKEGTPPEGTRIQVVGILEDGKYDSLTEDPEPAMFVPMLQSHSAQTYLLVRSSRDPQQLAAALKDALRNLDAGLPLWIETWNQSLQVALFGPRIATAALGVLGIMGAMLSITGIFGMAAYSVSKRIRELGIRIALGARRNEVLQSALGRPFKLLALGSVAGLLLGLLASKVLAFIVYQATPRDPLVLVGVVIAMALLGLLATWIPAQRALSIDPLILLRTE